MSWLEKRVRKEAAKFDKRVGLTDTGDHANGTATVVVAAVGSAAGVTEALTHNHVIAFILFILLYIYELD